VGLKESLVGYSERRKTPIHRRQAVVNEITNLIRGNLCCDALSRLMSLVGEFGW
jgi:hypothetical protein